MEKDLFEFGEFRLESPGGYLYCQRDRVLLSPKATQILLVLVENSGRVVLKDDLMKAVWPDTFVEESNLTFHIHAIRKALSRGEENGNERYIETVPRRGYRFLSPVRRLTPRPPASSARSAVRARAAWIGALLFALVTGTAMRLTLHPNNA
jgi:DNA-binding winged helix-turn-helix (wHTH) protein